MAGPNKARRLTLLILIPAVCLFFVLFGGHEVFDSLYGLPHRYDTLNRRGVQVDASLVKCAPGIGGGRGVGCRLHVRYGSFARTWDYREDSSQFAGLRPGDPVPLLLDPRHPTVAYTVRDVRRRTNTGLGAVFVLGVVFLIAGFGGGVWYWRLVRGTRSRN